MCLGCLSKMLKMKKIETLDCAVHWSCPFCIQELDLKVLHAKKNKWFTNSHHFLISSNKLRVAYINSLNEDREHLMHDMEEMIAVDSMQQELVSLFRRRTQERRTLEVGTRVQLALAEIARVNGLTVPELMLI
jgi:hypothetical protein